MGTRVARLTSTYYEDSAIAVNAENKAMIANVIIITQMMMATTIIAINRPMIIVVEIIVIPLGNAASHPSQ